MNNYYEILNLNQTMSCEELNAALKKMSMKWRQRLNAPALEDRQEAERITAAIAEARSILTDPVKRDEYDKQLMFEQAQSPQPTYQEFTRTQPEPEEEEDTQDIINQTLQMAEGGNDRKAMKYLFAKIHSGKQDPDLLEFAVYASLQISMTDEAIEMLQLMFTLYPEDQRTHAASARCAEAIESWNDLKEELDWLVEHGCENNDWVALARVRYFLKHDSEPIAAEIARVYIKENPQDIQFKQNVQGLYFQMIADICENEEKVKDMQQVGLALEYAKRANEVYPCGRAQEKISILERILKNKGKEKKKTSVWSLFGW